MKPDARRDPFAPGSVSLRLYPHLELPADEIVSELCAQGEAALAAGFDGVMTSEHHNGFAGYLPNPVQAAGWLLESMSSGWAAACPVLLTLRPPALVAEEVAWMAARFPGRVGVGVAAGSLDGDFAALGVSKAGLTARFVEGLAIVSGLLSGTAGALLQDDAALRRCRDHPVPVLSAANSRTAARRAAAGHVGLLFDSLAAPERCRELADAFRAAGGTGPVVVVRRVWLGAPPVERQDRQVDVYRGYAPAGAQAHWRGDQVLSGDDPSDLARRVAETVATAGADAVNIRVHVPGLDPAEARDQIAALSELILPLRRALDSIA